MSDYSCRTAFGRVGRKLSQHAYVDALDIRGFVTAKGEEVVVLSSWGATNRDIAAAAAAAKAKEEQLAAAQTEAVNAQRDNLRDGKSGTGEAPAPTPTASSLGTPGIGRRQGHALAAASTRSPSSSPAAARSRRRPPASAAPTTSCSPTPTRRARKRSRQRAEAAAISPDLLATPPTGPRARFLREAHAAACRIFGTTLGPGSQRSAPQPLPRRHGRAESEKNLRLTLLRRGPATALAKGAPLR